MEFTQPIPTTFSDEDILQAFYGCLENSDDGFLIVDPEGNIAYINEAYCDYIGVKQQEVLGRPVLQYIDTSRLPEAARNPAYKREVATLHKANDKQYSDNERYVLVNRTNVSVNGKSVAGVGQIKFTRNTMMLYSRLTNVFDELALYKEELKRMSADIYSVDNILGVSPQITALKKRLIHTAGNNFPVLINGETGTGKEVFANALHYAGERRNKPIVRINCAAIPSELLESELFGYEEGAFTGARRGGKKGKFELADGGTLFLDEIGDMPLVMQAKLLRVLQDGEIERVGGSKPIHVDVRIISATNKDLAKEVEEKRFRQDLYFRLNVIPFIIPPLRERKEDIPVLANAFLADLNMRYHSEVYFSEDTVDIMKKYNWPGNVRELRNIVERCFALQENGVITPNLLPGSLYQPTIVTPGYEEGGSLEAIMNTIERDILLSNIRRNGGNLRKTAAELKIHRVTLYKKMDKYGITREDFKVRP